jgi:hypothetical protein
MKKTTKKKPSSDELAKKFERATFLQGEIRSLTAAINKQDEGLKKTRKQFQQELRKLQGELSDALYRMEDDAYADEGYLDEDW